MEYRKNDIVTLEIVDCGTDGEGIGKADGFTVFVKDAVIGDTVKAKIMKAKKNYGYGRLMEILKPSPYRVVQYGHEVQHFHQHAQSQRVLC